MRASAEGRRGVGGGALSHREGTALTSPFPSPQLSMYGPKKLSKCLQFVCMFAHKKLDAVTGVRLDAVTGVRLDAVTGVGPAIVERH